MEMKVNITRIQEIVGDDSEMTKTLLLMFLNSCDRCIGNLSRSLTLGSEEAQKLWHDVTHELKGAAYNLGFDDLGDYCKKIEKEILSTDEKKKVIGEYIIARDGVEELLKTL